MNEKYVSYVANTVVLILDTLLIMAGLDISGSDDVHVRTISFFISLGKHSGYVQYVINQHRTKISL